MLFICPIICFFFFEVLKSVSTLYTDKINFLLKFLKEPS
jgi:hypothetical protein